MSDLIERHEDEAAKAFDPHLARRLLFYLRPYRVRATVSVALVIFSSILEVAGPAIIAIAVDLWVKPVHGAQTIGVSRWFGDWLRAHGYVFDSLTGINAAAMFYLVTLVAGFSVLYTHMVINNLMGQFILYEHR